MTGTAKTLIAFVALALCSGLGGFWAGSAARSPATNTQGTAMSAAAAELVRLKADAGLENLPAAVREAVEQGVAVLAGGGLKAAFGGLGTIEDPAEREQALIELIGQLDATQIAEMAQLMIDGELGLDDEGMSDGMVVAFAVIDRWVHLDQEAAAAFAVQNASDGLDGIMSILTMAFIAQRDVDRARELFAEMKRSNADVDDDMEDLIYLGVAFDDPARALRLCREDGRIGEGDIDNMFELVGARAGEALDEVLALPVGDARSELLGELFDAWANTDPHAALAAAAALSGGDERDGMISEVMRSLAQRDALAALGAAELLSEDQRAASVQEVVELWSRDDPAGALQWGLANLDADAFRNLLTRTEQHVDPALATELVLGMSEEARGEYFDRTNLADEDHFVQRMAVVDPAVAVAWCVEMGLFESHLGSPDHTGAQLARSALGHGREAASELVAMLPAGRLRNGYVATLAMETARTDPAAAVAWSDGLVGNERELAIRQVAAGWASSDPRAASEWSLASGSTPALVSSVEGWGKHDPEGAYRWLVEAQGNQPEEIAAIMYSSNLLRTWSEQDPAAAAEAMLGFPEDLAPAQMTTVAGSWASAEPSAVSNFINDRLEPGPVRDAAVAALVGQIKRKDPTGAADWARTISDAATMRSVLDRLAQ